MANTSLYQINTRVFCLSQKKTLLEIPQAYFKNLKKLGIEYIWLMGVWSPLSREYIKKYCMTDDLLNEYKKVLPDVSENDVIGSPFAISSYTLNKILGEKKDLLSFKEKLNSLGLKLILDFVPNHFGAGSKLLESNPEIFLMGSERDYKEDSLTFFKSSFSKDKYFAHGKDPNFIAWQDTVQVNYFSKEARDFMLQSILDIAKVSDGIRCDMAMLAVNDVFEKTWEKVINEQNFKKPTEEFWKISIGTVKKQYPNFLFMAEVYWDMEWSLQQLGFDFTYDKRLLERLEYSDANSIRDHLRAEKIYQEKSVRFIENHDEKRAIESLGENRSKMGAIIISTILGMSFYYDGQFEGKIKRLPVQLGREPECVFNKDLKLFYEKLLLITKNKVFKNGDWHLIEPQKGEDELSYNNILSWLWEYKEEKILVIINYSDYESSCHLKLNFGIKEKFVFYDLLSDISYEREKNSLDRYGLFVKLLPYNAHIFQISPKEF